MHLMYTISPEGKRIYTLKKVVDNEVTKSAHPARFSPDDKYSRLLSLSLSLSLSWFLHIDVVHILTMNNLIF